MSDEPQLTKLAIPFPKRLVSAAPGGFGTYVPHYVYVERLLLHLGPYDFTHVETIRGDVAAEGGKPALTNIVVGVVMRLTVTIDGRQTVIEEIGDVGQPRNWATDGARMKDAVSDALKRCCARIGLGLHLYCDDGEFMLLDSLRKQDAEPNADTQPPTNVDRDTGEVTYSEDDPGRPFTDG